MSVRIAATVALLLFLGGCGGEEAPPGTRSDLSSTPASPSSLSGVELTPAQQRGRELFDIVCWTCHGSSGRGDGPAVHAGAIQRPPDLLDSHYAEMTPDEIVRRFPVAAGERDPDHPHMQYVTSLITPEKFQDALRYVPALAYPTDLRGSAVAGQRIYEARCRGCHGEEGRGDGPWAAELRVRPPADFTHDTLLASRDYEAAFARIREGGRTVHGSSMPPWGMVLSEDEIWDVLAYISLFLERSGS